MDVRTKEERQKNMKAIRSRNTKPELYLRSCLFNQGFRYRVNVSWKKGHPDIWLAKYNTAIFVHGCFWHAHEGCRYFRIPENNREFWREKFQKNKERDLSVTRNLLNEGIRVLVIWECLIKKMKSNKVVEHATILKISQFINSDMKYLVLC